jgi:hypothetical protein
MTQIDQFDTRQARSSAIPAARALDNFSAAEVSGGEYVFLDNERLEYHTLNAPAFAVWQLCDGRRTAADISRALATTATPLPVEAVEFAAAELGEAGLLESPVETLNAGLTRRRVVKIAAAGVFGAVVLPAVSSITAPSALANHTCGALGTVPNNGHCVCSSECNSGCCCQTATGEGVCRASNPDGTTCGLGGAGNPQSICL